MSQGAEYLECWRALDHKIGFSLPVHPNINLHKFNSKPSGLLFHVGSDFLAGLATIYVEVNESGLVPVENASQFIQGSSLLDAHLKIFKKLTGYKVGKYEIQYFLLELSNTDKSEGVLGFVAGHGKSKNFIGRRQCKGQECLQNDHFLLLAHVKISFTTTYELPALVKAVTTLPLPQTNILKVAWPGFHNGLPHLFDINADPCESNARLMTFLANVAAHAHAGFAPSSVKVSHDYLVLRNISSSVQDC